MSGAKDPGQSEPRQDQAVEVTSLRSLVEGLQRPVVELIESVAAHDARIAELEGSLGAVRRSAKRQTGPFSA